MHLINDENGNVVPHGHEHNHSHEHTHGHTHEHGCSNCGDNECQGSCTEEVVALLNYMLSHNEHHAEELDQMAENLAKLGMEDAAKTIKEGVADFQVRSCTDTCERTFERLKLRRRNYVSCNRSKK